MARHSDLNSTLSEFLQTLRSGQSLPPLWYTDPALVRAEEELIFNQSWQYICRAEQVSKKGDYTAGHSGTIPVLVIMTDQGLKAFVNSCRHRRHPVLEGTGNKKVMQCPYHAWTYNLDGALISAPRCEREAAFKKEDLPLIPVQVEKWGPFVFVNPNMKAPSLASLLEGLSPLIAQSGLDLENLKFSHREPWESRSNWKVMIENYLECYHCPIQHPSFSERIHVEPDKYRLSSQGYFSSQVAPARKKNLLPLKSIQEAQYHFIWPNFTMNINPGPAHLSIDVWLPKGPENSHGFTEYYFSPELSEKEKQEIIQFNNEVSAEDDRLTQALQQNLHSGASMPSQILTQTEHLIIQFQMRIAIQLNALNLSQSSEHILSHQNTFRSPCLK